MVLSRLILLSSFLLIAGCTWPVRQRTDQTVCRIANQPIDIRPDKVASSNGSLSDARLTQANTAPPKRPVSPIMEASGDRPMAQPAKVGVAAAPTTAAVREASRLPEGPVANSTKNEVRYVTPQSDRGSQSEVDVRTAAWLGGVADPGKSSIGGERTAAANQRPVVAQTAAWLPAQQPAAASENFELNIPRRLPGSETPRVELPEGELAQVEAIQQVYPPLPPLPVEPRPLPGPDGRPYTLTDLQRIAAANSPALRQAIADVQKAFGDMQQARTYANPTGTFFMDPNANNTSSGVNGLGIEQVIKTAGKQKLAAAAAQKDYENAQLALRAARYDLATQVRRAYFALLVDRETLAVTRAVARFTDEIYRLQTAMLRAGPIAAYEPASLRAQAFATRLAYQQAIATYIYDWKSLVALLGLEQLPLTEVAGEIGRFIPYYDYDQVLAYTLRNHSDILRARNLVPQSRYKLKLAQVTPIPDLDATYRYAKDFTAFPFGSYSQFLVGMSLPLWDRNKGNIISAQASVLRATEEQHSAARDLTNRLADAYTNYQNNLYAIDYYRRYILPDLVRYYRGIYARRPLDWENINVGDLAFAQQSLSQNVTAYLQVLGSLWQSVVTVADFLQTDDLFQMATPRPLPELPDFDDLSRWACGHAAVAESCGVNVAPTLRGGEERSPVASGSTSRSAGPTTRSRSAGPTTSPRSVGATRSPRAGGTATPRRREDQ